MPHLFKKTQLFGAWLSIRRFYLYEKSLSVRLAKSEEIGKAFRNACIEVPSVVCPAAPDIYSENNAALGKRKTYFVLNYVFFCHFVLLSPKIQFFRCIIYPPRLVTLVLGKRYKLLVVSALLRLLIMPHRFGDTLQPSFF